MPPTTDSSVAPRRPYVLGEFGVAYLQAKQLAALFATLEPLERQAILAYITDQVERPSVDATALLLA